MRVLTPGASDLPALAPSQHDTKTTHSTADEGAETRATNPITAVTSGVPTVVLDTDAVSDDMAARLCVSFLGHILFLKNQVPFPIVQLSRMPMADNTSRATKKRQELLNSFDTLASHLYTTFIALSTALALRGTPEKAVETTEKTLLDYQKRGVARAFFAIALGPTVGTAKSRVIVGIDGLETKVWGLGGNDITKLVRSCDVPTEGRDENFLQIVSDTDDEEEQESGQESEGEESEHSDEVKEDASGSDGSASPPLSRSPSPVLSSDVESSPSTTSLDLSSRSSRPRTEDPEAVRAAERLLSRTLASACSEDDGQGLASEIAPTQIHVLLRAPRRFDHPSWIPRQNLCGHLDSFVEDFLVESGQLASNGATAKRRTKAGRVQGVWIKSRATITQIETSKEDLAEEDEMIWWSWDGKLAGFTDW